MKTYTDPRMHTAEHLLNATMVRLFGTERSFRAHIEKKKSKCDYRFHRDLTDEEAAAVERNVREQIEADLPVLEEFLSREEASRRVSLEKLPDNAGYTIRVIRIGEYDAVPCIGEHVSTTGEIDGFTIASRTFDNGVLRLRFTVGQVSSDVQ
jgi:misacylated tRNA(Ala) deacylase